MLKQIVHHSAKLVTFVVLLQLNLSKPQRRHVQYLVDAIIVSEAPHKTLSHLYGLIVDAPDPTNAADCLRISPWSAERLNGPKRTLLLADLLNYAQAEGINTVFVSVDDSLAEKDKATRHLEAVEFHHDHTKSSPKKQQYTNGLVQVSVRLQVGERAYSYDYRLYLREKTVRQLNRQRSKEHQLRYRSKYKLAREMLADLKQHLPKGYRVYVLFDSWYASNQLLKFCRRQGWHIICAIKSNRCLDGRKLSQWNTQLKHHRYERVTLTGADQKQRTYLVRTIQGKLKKIPFQVSIFISKWHRGDKHPKYFLCTDLTLSAQTGLSYYQRRWGIEVDNFYLKQLLGLGDFRVQSVEAIDKWYALVFLTLAYLQWQLYHPSPGQPLKTVAEVIRSHRYEHASQVLQTACQEVLQQGHLTPVLQRFIGSPPS